MRALACLIVLVMPGLAGLGHAARIPIHTYTTADGLPTSSVNCIARDSRGFLWLCSYDGLVRFDGYTFVTYGLKEGLPGRAVTAFLETHDGQYWVGTYNGVARFQPETVGTKQAPFTHFGMPGPEKSQSITALIEDREGTIWCGTQQGVFRKTPASEFQAIEMGLPATNWKTRFIQALAVDRGDALWVGTEDAGLYRRAPDGSVERARLPRQSISSVIVDRHGRIWAGSSDGICVLTPAPNGREFALTNVYGVHNGLPNSRVHALMEHPNGEIWAGTESGIGVLAPAAEHFTPLDASNGVAEIRALGVDPDDNTWAAANIYVMRIARAGLVTYTKADGLAHDQVTSMFADRQGRLCAVNGFRTIVLNRFDGQRFHSVSPRLIRGGKPIQYTGWGNGQTVLQDSGGDWWIPTGEGLCRFTGIRRFEDLARIAPKNVYTRGDGLPGDDIFRLFEDSHRDIWIATVDTPGLSRWQRSTGHIQRVTDSEGFRTSNAPDAFAEDRAGDLWVGLFWKGLARYRNGRWRMFLTGAEAPVGSLCALVVDHKGRLWIGSNTSGLLRVDDPAADAPRFIPYTTEQGLSSNLIWSLVEDRQGQIYIGGERGVDVLNPETGRVLHFSSADGLAPGDLKAAFCDRAGSLWFGATLGLSRLTPEIEHVPAAPQVLITALRASGQAQPVSALGALSLAGLQLGSNQNYLDVEFASFSFRAGNPIRYQYRLNTADPRWRELGEARAVHLDGLAPGAYSFQVRAIREGLASHPPAQIAFRVLPPIWRRWWSISLMVLALLALLYTAYRFRVAQLVEMEKVRTRIAMDLHDDIGASLSQIAILSEIARREAGANENPVTQSLGRVADISRELAGALGDIVWAVNPQRDRVGDLVQRMRRFGGDVLNSRNIEFDCVATEDLLDTELSADLRRQVLLVFKESIHNIARHSGCGRARAELTLRDRQLCLTVNDDGAGFDADARWAGGNGLSSMKKRAVQMGGLLYVKSGRGQGTTILLTIPLRRRYPFRW